MSLIFCIPQTRSGTADIIHKITILDISVLQSWLRSRIGMDCIVLIGWIRIRIGIREKSWIWIRN